MKIQLFGYYISIHRKEQWLYKNGKDYKPWLCVHVGRENEWEKRVFCI